MRGGSTLANYATDVLIFVAVLAGFVGLLVLVAKRGKAKEAARERELRAIGRALGLEYRRDDPSVVDGVKLPLFHEQRPSTRFQHVLTGRYRDAAAAVFERWAWRGSSDEGNWDVRTCAVVDGPADLPPIRVVVGDPRGAGIAGKLFERWRLSERTAEAFGLQPVTGLDAGGEPLRVHAADPGWASRALDAEIRGWLGGLGLDCVFEVGDGKVLWSSERRPAGESGQALDTAIDFRDRLLARRSA